MAKSCVPCGQKVKNRYLLDRQLSMLLLNKYVKRFSLPWFFNTLLHSKIKVWNGLPLHTCYRYLFYWYHTIKSPTQMKQIWELFTLHAGDFRSKFHVLILMWFIVSKRTQLVKRSFVKKNVCMFIYVHLMSDFLHNRSEGNFGALLHYQIFP